MYRSLPATLCVLATLASAACGSRQYPAPLSPESAVTGFLNAVKAQNLNQMGRLWGSKKGPAVSYMDRTTLEQRLTVMRIYLEHDSFAIVPPNQSDLALPAGERLVRVRLNRRGCASTVPFTLVRYNGGWLVSNIDLAAAGNPAVGCAKADAADSTRSAR